MTTGKWNTALVTGASAGIGNAIARKLAAEGTALIVVARDAERLEKLAAELKGSDGIDVEVLPADLTNPEDRSRVEERVAESARPIDLLVNNAGFGTSGQFHELPVDGEDEEIQLNVTALVRLTHAALPGMIERGRGAILNVSSLAALTPSPGNATYAATKAFVESFTEAIHEELRGTGVTATSVLPGYTRTEFQSRAGYEAADRLPSFLWLSAEQVAGEALAAAHAGKARVVPGLRYKAMAALTEPVPSAIKRRAASLANRRTK